VNEGLESRLPATWIGRWLLASLLGRTEQAAAFVPRLNGGARGWNLDEPAVVEAVCTLVSSEALPPGGNDGAVTAFVYALISRGGNPGLDQAVLERVVLDARGHTVDLGSVNAAELLQLRTYVAAWACRVLGYNSHEQVVPLVLAGERRAFEQGFHPSMAGLERE